MKKLTAILLLVSLMITGCSSAKTSSQETPESTNESTVSDDKTASEDPNTVTAINGEMPIPTKFDNFLAFGMSHIDHLASLEVLPVAATMPTLTLETPPARVAYYNDGFGRIYKDGQVDGVEPLSKKFEESIERIIELKPDFILATDAEEKYLDKLEAIAPTYLIPGYVIDENGMRDWRPIHRLYGKLLGKSEKAEENIANYDAMLKEYKEKIGDSVKGKTALIYQISSTGKGLWMSGKDSAPQIYSEFGFELPENFTETGDYYAFEELVTLNPDYMFINIGSYEEYEKLKNTPIWDNLTAVKNGKVFEYSHYIWTQTGGYLSNSIKLQDIGNFILDGTQVGTYLSKEQ